MSRFATIVSTGSYLPEIEISNDTLRARLAHLPDYVDKMEAATGILKRWHAPDDWATSDLALRAASQALERAGRKAEDLDLIILGTDSPDFITPATSVVLQDKLGARNAGTFDVSCACASFPTGLAAAAGLIATNPSLSNVLVVGAYMMHRLADPLDPAMFFYGDGAGAAILTPSEKPGFIASAMHADGSYSRYWGIYAGGTAEPASEVAVREGRTKVQLVKRYPPQINEEGWPRIVGRLLRNGSFELSDVDLFIFTQVRKPTIVNVMAALGAPLERAHTIMENQGYTGSACVGMALDDAIAQGKIRPGGLVVMIGSGVGYNQAGVAFRMPS
jgi:3-oxoacyl-[acyl-carrier-protein] synthase-3